MHLSGLHIYSLFSIVIFISVLATISSPLAHCETITDQVKHDELNYKLNLVLDRLDRLDQKIDSLQRECQNNYAQSSGSDEHKQASARISSDADASSTITKRNAKREDAPEASLSKDLFPFNKLADNLSNSIPSSSSKEQLYDNPDTSLNGPRGSLGQTSGGQLSREERILAPISQHYESLFGTALDNLSVIIKEQLTGFRLTLNKLMNRMSDHNYQHNVLVSQLSLVKDECSLAASNSVGTAGKLACSNDVPTNNTPKPSQTQVADKSIQPIQNTMRSSDITMMVRLLSEELNQLIQKSVATMTREQQLAQLGQHQPETDEQERRANLDTKIDGDLQLFRRQLAEIDSVVKQTALLMNKLASQTSPDSFNVQPLGLNRQLHHRHHHNYQNEQQLHHRNGHLDDTQQQSTLTTLTYTNANEANENNTAATELATGQANNKTSIRWFPGSKVPNQRQYSPLGDSLSQQSSYSQPAVNSRQVPKCQAKTSLVRPTSCRHLREAGANCTGRYYVFIRGSIRHVYCDMNMDSSDDGGGWTVVLRRIDKSLPGPAEQEQQQEQTSASPMAANRPPHQSSALNWLESIKAAQVDFNQDWATYKSGFGQLDNWSEFFVGLDLLHQLTTWPNNNTNFTSWSSSSTVELQLDLMTNASHELHLKFDHFSIEDELTNYRLHVGNCNSSNTNQCQPILRLNGTKFYTPDRIHRDFCASATSNNASVTLSSSEKGPELDNKPVLASWWWPISERPGAGGASTSESSLFDCDPVKGARWNLPDVCDTDAAHCPLTGPLGKPPKSSSAASHLYWPHWQYAQEPVRQLVLKVRQRRASM